KPGDTLLHCHQQLHMDFGFMALFKYAGPEPIWSLCPLHHSGGRIKGQCLWPQKLFKSIVDPVRRSKCCSLLASSASPALADRSLTSDISVRSSSSNDVGLTSMPMPTSWHCANSYPDRPAV